MAAAISCFARNGMPPKKDSRHSKGARMPKSDPYWRLTSIIGIAGEGHMSHLHITHYSRAQRLPWAIRHRTSFSNARRRSSSLLQGQDQKRKSELVS